MPRVRLIWFVRAAIVPAIAMASICLSGCTRGSNAHAPLMEPKPVIDVTGAVTATSLRADTLDRSHWPAWRTNAVDGTVAHPSAWVDSPLSIAGREGEGEFAARETVLGSADDSATGLGEGLLAPVRAVWGFVAGPFVELFGDEREASPDRNYQRIPVANVIEGEWRGVAPAATGN